MTIKQYLLRAYLWIVTLFLMMGITDEPVRSVAGYVELALASVLFPMFSTLLLAVLASLTHFENRKDFWSYRWANYVMLFPGSFFSLSFVVLTMLGFEDAS